LDFVVVVVVVMVVLVVVEEEEAALSSKPWVGSFVPRVVVTKPSTLSPKASLKDGQQSLGSLLHPKRAAPSFYQLTIHALSSHVDDEQRQGLGFALLSQVCRHHKNMDSAFTKPKPWVGSCVPNSRNTDLRQALCVITS
jgi:hypothetical protein